jgi:hypothetical protein
MDRSQGCQQMTAAALATLARDYQPRDLAKWFARALGCSIRSGKRYAAHPELFPKTRVEDLLLALEAEDAAAEERRTRRREQFEGIRRELSVHLGLDDGRLPLPRDRMARGSLGGAVGQGRDGLPPPRGSA